MNETTCHFCGQPVELEEVDGEIVMKTHGDGTGNLCTEGSGERPVAVRHETD